MAEYEQITVERRDDLDLVQRREMAALEEAFGTPEHQEAVNAFLEKRPPKFR